MTTSVLRSLMLGFQLSVGVLVLTAPTAGTALSIPDIRHLLTRTGFGASPHDFKVFRPLSREQAIDRILSSLRSDPVTAPPEFTKSLVPNYWKAGWHDDANITLRENEISQIRAWWIGEMAATPSPFTERLALFWHGRFVSRYSTTALTIPLFNQIQTFRQLGAGNYRTLIKAMLRDPMMLSYLDNVENTRIHPNENLAREELELFTLGPGNYKEADIKALARVLAGHHVAQNGGWIYWVDPTAVDTAPKMFLGNRIEGPPEHQIDAVVDAILRQKAAARFLCGKLYKEFVSTDVDPEEVDRLAGILTSNNYEIRPVLRAMLTGKGFWSHRSRGALVKSPIDLVVGFARTFGVPLPDTAALQLYSGRLGQTLLDPPTVAGWPGGDNWLTTSSLIARKKVMERLWGMAESLRENDAHPSDRGLRLLYASEYAAVPAKLRVTINGMSHWDVTSTHGNWLRQEAGSDNPANIKPAWESFFIAEAKLPTRIDTIDVSLVTPSKDTAAFVNYIDLNGARATAIDARWLNVDSPQCSREVPIGMLYCAAVMRFHAPFQATRDDRTAPLNSIVEYGTARMLSPLLDAHVAMSSFTTDMLLPQPAMFRRDRLSTNSDLERVRQLTLDPAFNLK